VSRFALCITTTDGAQHHLFGDVGSDNYDTVVGLRDNWRTWQATKPVGAYFTMPGRDGPENIRLADMTDVQVRVGGER